MQRISPKVFCTENPQNVNQNVNITLRSEASGSTQIISEVPNEKVKGHSHYEPEALDGQVIYPIPELPGKTREANTYNPSSITESFLKLIIQAYMNNPIKLNYYIICTVPDLEKLIEVLTGCDRCDIDIADPDINCCGKEVTLPYTIVSKIWVTHGQSKELFKYRYSDLLQVFETYRISLKLVDV